MSDMKKNPVLITKICLLLVIGAFVFSFLPRVGAQSAAGGNNLPSIYNLNGIIPNSDELPRVSIGSFLKNIVETTGIFAFATDKVEKETTLVDNATGKNRTTMVFGWQELLMVAVGFLIIYLGAVKGLNPCSSSPSALARLL
jgi:oxaloacetate decarboxylase beta subunit